jgi:hypothetical protein
MLIFAVWVEEGVSSLLDARNNSARPTSKNRLTATTMPANRNLAAIDFMKPPKQRQANLSSSRVRRTTLAGWRRDHCMPVRTVPGETLGVRAQGKLPQYLQV